MTFASVNDMRIALEFVFAAFAIVGTYTLVLVTFLAVWSALHAIRAPKPPIIDQVHRDEFERWKSHVKK